MLAFSKMMTKNLMFGSPPHYYCTGEKNSQDVKIWGVYTTMIFVYRYIPSLHMKSKICLLSTEQPEGPELICTDYGDI